MESTVSSRQLIFFCQTGLKPSVLQPTLEQTKCKGSASAFAAPFPLNNAERPENV